ncbi:hypothetical protein ABIB38_000260 [Massilia sp. UYP11]|uniref:hypothetical protein n=1 Tax=Massilia sp. UYP11 TaxID=1756385 RepID=UPI003D1AC05C
MHAHLVTVNAPVPAAAVQAARPPPSLQNRKNRIRAVEKPLHIHSIRCAEQAIFAIADLLSQNRASHTQALSILYTTP